MGEREKKRKGKILLGLSLLEIGILPPGLFTKPALFFGFCRGG